MWSTKAARHHRWPVILGAAVAFVVLNTLAVLFGASVTAGLVAILFGAFGIHALRAQDEDNSEKIVEKPGHSIFVTTLLLIFAAEFGDKTQITVAGLASSMTSFPVWLGSTIALVLVSMLGIWFGRTVLQRFPLLWLHRLSGVIFIVFALLASWRALTL